MRHKNPRFHGRGGDFFDPPQPDQKSMHQEKLIFGSFVRNFRPKQVLNLSLKFKPKTPHKEKIEHLVAISKMGFSAYRFWEGFSLDYSLSLIPEKMFRAFSGHYQ